MGNFYALSDERAVVLKVKICFMHSPVADSADN